MVFLQLADCVLESFTAFFCIGASRFIQEKCKSANGEKEANLGWDLSYEQNREQKRFDLCF